MGNDSETARPVEIESQRERVLREMETAIINGEFAPGERLDERMLAERFKVSRTPVREALNSLASTVLVENRGRQGCYVATLSVAEMFQAFEVMAELESYAARLAALRMSEEERTALIALAARFPLDGPTLDLADYIAHAEAFHRAIYRGAHNPVLEEIALQVYRRTLRYRRQTLVDKGRMYKSAAEHRETAAAIASGDAEKAANAMSHHMDIRRLDHADFVSLIMRISEQRPQPVKD
ncbi:GntR family transcriptional regulator [Acuticoccus kandeliae]|uniref:GntR family transcriptional regulator n=1 Tax=Acuticoccus kandeliae TaxID=2073160 RepID=UPI000D3E82AA|nr:GntR family transcriptional regulator [Acuticoccus kandeliae]